MIARRRARIARLRRRVHFILDGGVADRTARLIHALIISLIVLSVASVVLETVPELQKRYALLFDSIEFVALVGFSIEYALRIWSAPDSAPYFGMPPWRARLAYARTPYAIPRHLRPESSRTGRSRTDSRRCRQSLFGQQRHDGLA